MVILKKLEAALRGVNRGGFIYEVSILHLKKSVSEKVLENRLREDGASKRGPD